MCFGPFFINTFSQNWSSLLHRHYIEPCPAHNVFVHHVRKMILFHSDTNCNIYKMKQRKQKTQSLKVNEMYVFHQSNEKFTSKRISSKITFDNDYCFWKEKNPKEKY